VDAGFVRQIFLRQIQLFPPILTAKPKLSWRSDFDRFAIAATVPRNQGASSRFGHQIGQREAEHFGDPAQVEDGNISLPALDRADERSMQVAAFAEFLLRMSGGDPSVAKPFAQAEQKMAVVEIHA
jgi:hypothetical protein